jgi:hypothetical protein
MARMTEEEAHALDDFVTNNEITLGPNGSGWLSQREHIVSVQLLDFFLAFSAKESIL